MMFKANVTSVVPRIYHTVLTIEADSMAEAEAKIKAMHDADKIEFDVGENDYDQAKLEVLFIADHTGEE